MTIRSNQFANFNNDGAPDFPFGLNQTGLEYLEFQVASQVSGLTTNTVYDIVFNDQINNTFTTSEYNSTTGIFTATRTGVYLVNFNCRIQSDTADQLSGMLIYIVKNGSLVMNTQDAYPSAVAGRFSQSLGMTVPLVATDTLKMQVQGITASGTWSIREDSSTVLSIAKLG